MHARLIALLAGAVLAIAACGGSTSSLPPTAGPTAPSTPAPAASAAATRIEVNLTDALRIEPAEMRVPMGVPVTFVVTNRGALDHEFYLGDEDAQAKHESEMGSMDGMTQDDPAGIAVAPGETKELTYTFDSAGATLAGCHVQGHYLAGMKAAITVGQ